MKEELTIRQNGNRVLLLSRGKLVADMPWEAAMTVAKAMIAQARKAEETDKALLIVADQAILTRHAMPFGLSNNAKILKEAWKDSQYLPGPSGIEPKSVVGTPAIVPHTTKEKT